MRRLSRWNDLTKATTRKYGEYPLQIVYVYVLREVRMMKSFSFPSLGRRDSWSEEWHRFPNTFKLANLAV